MTALGPYGRRKYLIDIVIPTLWRAERLERLTDNIDEATTASHRTLYVAERHDTESVAEIRRLAYNGRQVKLVFNTHSANVGGAFNSGFEAVRAPYWFAGGDDLLFHPQWDEPCLSTMLDPDLGAKIVGTRDLVNPHVEEKRTATHFLVDTEYTRTLGLTFDEEPGLVAWEGMGHDYFDTEICDVAKTRGVFQPCLASIVEHLHWCKGRAEVDRTYQRNLDLCKNDPALYADRLLAWETKCAAL